MPSEQVGRQTDAQVGRQAGRQIGRQARRQTERQTDARVERQTERQLRLPGNNAKVTARIVGHRRYGKCFNMNSQMNVSAFEREEE